jgi:transposase-like protein
MVERGGRSSPPLPLSYRDVEELLAERGLDVSYETVRRWVLKFGPPIARKREAEIKPDRVLNDLGRKSMAAI